VSASATFWAWSQDVRSSHKLVLLALANCHNDSTGQCNPSVQYISDQTGLNRKTVMSSLSSLEKTGLIIPVKTFGSSNSYTLQTSTKNGTTTDDKTSTEIGTSTKNGPVPKTDITSTKNGTRPVPKTGHESKKKLKESYKYKNTTIKLTDEDFTRMQSTYSKLDLVSELDQLDLELTGQPKWFMTMHAKLNYRNKMAGGKHAANQQPDKPRSPIERFNARRKAEPQGDGNTVGQDVGSLRAQVGNELRAGTHGRLVQIVDGDYTQDDR